MAVYIDDSRTYPLPGNIQLRSTLSLADRTDFGNPPVLDRQIGPERRTPCPVQDLPASQDQVLLHAEESLPNRPIISCRSFAVAAGSTWPAPSSTTP